MFNLTTTAQTKKKDWAYDLELSGVESNIKLRASLQIPSNVSDSMSAILETNQILERLHQQAYLRATIHSFSLERDSCFVRIDVGDRIQWAHLRNGNLDPALLQRFRIPEWIYQDQPIYFLEVIQLQKRIIKHLENNGYPFASCWLDSFIIDNTNISAALYLDKGPYITYQKIELIPKENTTKKLKIKKGYLASYLNIKENELYKETDILALQRKMDNLTFIRSYRSPLIQFSEEEAKVQLFLEDKPSSRVDLLVGLLPGIDPITNQQRFDFTGNIHIDLLNPFGTGKQLFFKWQQVKEGISDVRVKLNWPYLLQVPLGVDLSFHLYKRDTTFIDIVGDIGVQYLFNGNSFVKVYYKPSITNLIQINSNAIIASRSLPSTLDFNNSNVGLQLQLSTLDYPISPQKGFRLFLDVDIGLKKVRRNQQILSLSDPNDAQFDFNSLYDSINTDFQRYSITFTYAHFIPLWSWSTLMTQLDAAIILSNQPLYNNELFRIGGSRRLRGFDEESILTSWYNIMTLEWRFLFNQNSYVYAFGDVCYLESKSIDSNVSDWPVGFGIGLALQTRVGLFGLTYALGGRTGSPISIRSGKVHFGYIYAF